MVATGNVVGAQDCDNDIAHFKCYILNNGSILCSSQFCSRICSPKGLICDYDYGDGTDSYFTVTPGYWFSNGFIHFTRSCLHCDRCFDLYNRINQAKYNNSIKFPTSDDQCVHHWTGLACGECNDHHSIIYDSTKCVPSTACSLSKLSYIYSLILFFLISIVYWIIVISFIFVLLHFKFDIAAGYAYGFIFFTAYWSKQ